MILFYPTALNLCETESSQPVKLENRYHMSRIQALFSVTVLNQKNMEMIVRIYLHFPISMFLKTSCNKLLAVQKVIEYLVNLNTKMARISVQITTTNSNCTNIGLIYKFHNEEIQLFLKRIRRLYFWSIAIIYFTVLCAKGIFIEYKCSSLCCP